MEAPNLKVIQFYRGEGPHGFLSNFYRSEFIVNNKKYTTNEHYFQSKKFEGKAVEQLIIQTETPAQAFRLGRNANIPLREDWSEVKEKVMYEGLYHKFTQNKDLLAKLLQTKNIKLIQHTKNDKYWADGGNGSGQNRLGILLMKLRDQLRKKQQQ